MYFCFPSLTFCILDNLCFICLFFQFRQNSLFCRYAREGHLSYYKLDHLIPPEVTLTTKDMNFLSNTKEITHNGMRRIIGSMAKFLGVTGIICPDFLPLIHRYCTELSLPSMTQKSHININFLTKS